MKYCSCNGCNYAIYDLQKEEEEETLEGSTTITMAHAIENYDEQQQRTAQDSTQASRNSIYGYL